MRKVLFATVLGLVGAALLHIIIAAARGNSPFRGIFVRSAEHIDRGYRHAYRRGSPEYGGLSGRSSSAG